MDNETETKMAQLTYAFMQRVTLRGDEVQNFNAAVNWLASKAQQGQQIAEPPQAQPSPPVNGGQPPAPHAPPAG